MDMLQTDHALSGIDIALWDALGHKEQAPVWSLLGHVSKPQTAYASPLFGETFTRHLCRRLVPSLQTSHRAAKFGWGPIGLGTLQDADRDHPQRQGRDWVEIEFCWWTPAMRSTTIWNGPALESKLSKSSTSSGGRSRLRTGLYRHTPISRSAPRFRWQPVKAHTTSTKLKQTIDYGKVRFIQIDTGRIGGITAAKLVASYASSRGVHYVNHTFTSNLALSASLQPYIEAGGYAETPVKMSSLAVAIGGGPWNLDQNGCIQAPDKPGLGVDPELVRLQPYLQEVEFAEWAAVVATLMLLSGQRGFKPSR